MRELILALKLRVSRILSGKNRKRGSSFSVISGSDGPTSIFLLAGQTKGKRKKRERYLKKQADMLVAKPHSIAEAEAYIMCRYGAVQVKKTDREYEDNYRNMKAGWVLQHRPDLISAPMPAKLKNIKNAEEVECYLQENMLRYEEACRVSDSIIPLDVVLYSIDVMHGNAVIGKVMVIIERVYGNLTVSYSCNTDKTDEFDAVVKDVYTYYGVSQKDIDTRSDRFMSLISVMRRL